MVVAIGYGALDEWHQSFVDGRTGDIRDVGRDAIGAVIVVFLSHAAAAAGVRLARGEWVAFGRITFGTLALLDGMAVVWVTSLWLLAGPNHGFSLEALQRADFLTSLLQRPAALTVAIPFLAVAFWIGRGHERSLLRQVALLEAPTVSAALVLGVPFAVYGMNLAPDRTLVWAATWVMVVGVWLLVLPLLLAMLRSGGERDGARAG